MEEKIMLSPRFIQDARRQAYKARDLRVVVELAQMQAAHDDIRGAIETLRGLKARPVSQLAGYPLHHLKAVANALEKHEPHVRNAMQALDESPHVKDFKEFDLTVSAEMKENEPVLGVLLADQADKIIDGEEIPEELKEGFEQLFQTIRRELKQKNIPQTQANVNRSFKEIVHTIKAQGVVHQNYGELTRFVRCFVPYSLTAENKKKLSEAIRDRIIPIFKATTATEGEIKKLVRFFHDYNYYYYRVKRLKEET